MSVYIDRLAPRTPRNYAARCAGRKHGQMWAHMWADTDAELTELAQRIGLKTTWIHRSARPHYDLVPTFRKKAVAAGAVEIEYSDWLRNRSVKT